VIAVPGGFKAATMSFSGDLIQVALLALAVTGCCCTEADRGVVDHPDTDADGRRTTPARAPASRPPPSTTMYLPKLPVQEPADPCKAGKLVAFVFLF